MNFSKLYFLLLFFAHLDGECLSNFKELSSLTSIIDTPFLALCPPMTSQNSETIFTDVSCTYLDSAAQASGSIDKSTGHFTIAISINGEVALSKITSDAPSFLPTVQNPVLIFSNWKNPQSYYGVPVEEGFSCAAMPVFVSGAMADFLQNININKIFVASNLSKKNTIISLRSHSQAVCLNDALTPYIVASKLSGRPNLVAEIKNTCFIGPQITVLPDIDAVEVRGNTKKGEGVLEARVSSSGNMTVAMMNTMKGAGKPSQADSSLRFLDNYLSLSKETFIYKSGGLQGVKEKSAALEETVAEVFANNFNDFNAGVTSIYEGSLGGELQKVLGSDLLVKVYTQPGIISAAQEDMSIFVPNMKDRKFCVSDMFNSVSGGSDYQKVISKLGDTICFNATSIEINQEREEGEVAGAVYLVIGGTAQIFGKDEKIEVWMALEGGFSITLVIKKEGTFDVTDFSTAFAPVKSLISVTNPLILLASGDNGPRMTFFETPKGLSVGADVAFSGFIAPILKPFQLTSAYARIGIPLTLSFDGFSVLVTKEYDPAIKLNIIDIDEAEVLIKGAVPLPEVELLLTTYVGLGDKKIKTLFSGSLEPQGFSLEGQIQEKVLNNPFGFPIQIEDPTLILNFAAGVPSGLGGGGSFKVGNADLAFFMDIDLANPKKVVCLGITKKLCFTDLVALWQVLAKKSVPSLMLPGIGCLSDSYLIFSLFDFETLIPMPEKLQDTLFVKYGVPKGISFSGDFDLFGMKIHSIGNISTLGIHFTGETTPFNEAGGLLQFTSTKDLSVGPTLKGVVDLIEQQITLDGLLRIGKDPVVIQGTSTMNIEPTKASFDVNGKLLAFDVNIEGLTKLLPTGEFAFEKTSLNGTITNGFSSIISSAQEVVVRDIKTLQDKVDGVIGKINAGITSIEKECKAISFPGCSTILNPFKKTIDSLSALQKVVMQMSTQLAVPISFKQATFSTNLSTFSTGVLPGLSLDMVLLGNEQTVKIDSFNLQSPDIKTVAQRIFDKIKPQSFDSILSGAQSLLSAPPLIIQNLLLSGVEELPDVVLSNIKSLLSKNVFSVVDNINNLTEDSLNTLKDVTSIDITGILKSID